MIILTGAKGFIGKKFFESLKGKKIIEVEKDNCWHFRQNFSEWQNVEFILHQGALSSTTETNLQALYNFNVEYSQWILSEAMQRNIPIKYASSASVYGNMTDGTINPLNQYALSKVIIDYWVQDNIKRFSSLVQGFRYFNVYGDGEEHKGSQASPISKFTKEIKETGKLNLFEGSDQFLRDFVCVDDIVDIVLNNDAPSGIYDIGTGCPVSFQHVAEEVAKKENGKINIIPFPKNLKGKYQTYTKAKMDWLQNYNFTTVSDYIKSS